LTYMLGVSAIAPRHELANCSRCVAPGAVGESVVLIQRFCLLGGALQERWVLIPMFVCCPLLSNWGDRRSSATLALDTIGCATCPLLSADASWPCRVARRLPWQPVPNWHQLSHFWPQTYAQPPWLPAAKRTPAPPPLSQLRQQLPKSLCHSGFLVRVQPPSLPAIRPTRPGETVASPQQFLDNTNPHDR
jgi:hypothetical protein